MSINGSLAKKLLGLRKMGVGHVVAPGVSPRLLAAAKKVPEVQRRRGVEALRSMDVEVEGAGVVPLAFVDRSAGIGVDNGDLVFLGTPVVQLYVRSFLLQRMNSSPQEEVEAMTQYLLAPRNVAGAYSMLPTAEVFMASPETHAATVECLESGHVNATVEALLTSQLYALAGALHLEKGMDRALAFTAQHVMPNLLDV